MGTKWAMQGTLLGACSCDWGCPCSFDAPPTQGYCEGGYVWHIEKGTFGNVPLDGLSWSWIAHSPGPLHKGNVRFLVLADEKMYGFHGHFSTTSCMLMFGGGFKPGYTYGKTADRHPMIAVENPVRLEDAHATLYKAMGIAPDTNYVFEGRPIYVTNNGKGVPVDDMLL